MYANALEITNSATNSSIIIGAMGSDTNVDIDTVWLNKELQRGMDALFPLSESEWIKGDKDTFNDDRLTREVYEKTASAVSTAQWADSSLLARRSNFWFPQGCLGMR